MATTTFGGTDTSTVGYTDDWVRTSSNVMPTVRQAADGSRPIRTSRVRAYVSGRGASRSVTLELDGQETSSFTVDADSSAQLTSWRTLVRQMESGDSAQCQINGNGSFYFGRGGSGSTVDSYGTSFSGKLYFGVEYAQAPSAPGTPTLSPSSTPGQVGVSWAAPSDDGDSSITGYRIQYATNSAFTTGVGTKDVGNVTSDTITGLTPGQTYYFRVAAKNAVTTGASTTGVYGGSRSANLGTVPSAPAAPTLTTGPGMIDVVWVAPANGGVPIDSYRVDYTTDPAFGSFASVTVTGATTLAKALVGLTPDTTYYVRVLAHNSVGWSAAGADDDANTPVRGALDIVQSAALHLADGTQVELRSDSADSPTVTLGYIAFGTGSTFVSIATLPIGTGAGDFAAPGGPRNLALVADPNGHLYVIGRRGDSESTVLVKRWDRTGTTTWVAGGTLSQALASTGDPLVGFAACYVPGTGTGSAPSIFLLARRAGTLGTGALSYATLSIAAIIASSGSLFLASGSDPAWLGTPPSSGRNTGPVDVAPLTSSGVRLAVLGNGFAVVDVTNGVVAGVAKAANGTATPGPWARVIGVNATTLAVLSAVSGALAWSFYSTTGTLLGSGTYAGANAWGGAFGAQWDAIYDRVATVVTAYYVADPAGARTLESIDINTSSFAASAPASLTAALGAASSTNAELRVPSRIVDERRVLVAAANDLTGAKSTAAYVDTSGNVAPNAPALVTLEGYDASLARTFAWAFSDPNALDGQTAYEVEIQRVSDSVNVVDTGKVTSGALSYLVNAATLTNGVDYRWRARTWDALDSAGAWSAYDAFTTAALGSLTITDPSTDNPAGLEVSTYEVVWNYVQGSGYVQTQRRVRVVRTSDSAVLSDTTMQASTATSRVVALPTDTEVRVEVSIVTNAPGTPTVGPVTRLITSSYGTPMQPLVTLEAGLSYIAVTVQNPEPSGDQPLPTSNVIERRRTGADETFVPIAEIEPNGSYNDHAVRSGVDYDYRVRAEA